MPRKLRTWYPGATYHIYARGNRRSILFHNTQDYQKYLKILEDVRENYPFVLHSYCLMTNHIHLQIETTTYHIQDIIKPLHMRYAMYLNRRLDLTGHVFQGRYGSSLINNTHSFLEVSRYIHRNPLEASMVKAMHDYPWSSYSSYINHISNPHVDSSKTYSFFQEPAHKNYQLFVEEEREK
ncbi:transposase [Metabacillus indicus]|uniref:transposase n=1 Tax=Metabacillus indicus TaxID=246786 RepID=UPI0004930D92|nr:transposase [Metabacillus indicus]KEZ48787.1 hypothetical protein AZ46_0218040 [Metabacillus indicus LMG 22858]